MRQLNHNFYQLSSILICFLFSLPLFAADQKPEKWYEVEIIVFAYDIESQYDSEIWQERPGFPKIVNTVEIYSPAELMLEDYTENLPTYLTEPELQDVKIKTTKKSKKNKNLSNHARKLALSSKYQLLLHRTWRQTLKKRTVYLTDKPDTSPVDFTNSIPSLDEEVTPDVSPEDMLMKALLEEEKQLNQSINDVPFFLNEHDQIQPFDEVRDIPQPVLTPLSYEGPPQHLIYGNFTLSKGRYLHMELDFLYRGEPYIPPASELSIEETFPMANDTNELNEEKDSAVENTAELPGFISNEKLPLVGFRIKESKRVRLNNIYYFDHPLFGALVRISRYTLPPPEEKVAKNLEQ